MLVDYELFSSFCNTLSKIQLDIKTKREIALKHQRRLKIEGLDKWLK